jgi:hypothetical protein
MTDRPLSALAIACLAAEKPTQAMLDAEAAFWRAFDAGDMATMREMADRMGVAAGKITILPEGELP